MREAFGRGGSTHNPARRRPGEAGARARGGLGLAQLAEERLDVLEELLRAEAVDKVARPGEALHRQLTDRLLEPPFGRIVEGRAETSLARDHQDGARCPPEPRFDERLGILTDHASIDERGVDVAEVGEDALRSVEAAHLTIGPLAARPG